MKRKRKYIPLVQKLASALSKLLPYDQEVELRRHRVSARHVIRMFDADHIVLHALGGPDGWWNLDLKLREPHRIKSANDTSIVAKVRRLEPQWKDFTARMARKRPGKSARPKSNWPSRKLVSRNSFERRAP